MLNLLIASVEAGKKLKPKDTITLYIPDIRISYLAKDGREALQALTEHNYDLVLLDNKLTTYDGLDILDRLPCIKYKEYEKSIILLTNSKTLSNNIKSHSMIFDSFLNTESFSLIISSLKKLAETKKENETNSIIKDKIINELQNIGYNLSHCGTHYIAETVLLIATANYNFENLSKNVYPKVSEIYNNSLNNIKTNIITATDAAYRNNDTRAITKYLHIPDNIKPTAKMVINAILQKIKS